jgi:hypothetical protein
LRETFPARGTSGYVAWLEVQVDHGRGETLLPGGWQLAGGGDGADYLKRAGFRIPSVEGPVTLKQATTESGDTLTTTLKLPFVTLPKEPGRQLLTLPSLPIAIERSSGDIVTVCTGSHSIEVEDPLANDPDPSPKENPQPLPPVELWEALKYAVYGGLAALALGSLLYFAVRAWLGRRPLPPPPPPRPPWVTALEALHDIRQARLIEQERYADHFDRVSDAVRRYLGDRFGFDGMESTTREVLAALEKVPEALALMPELQAFLKHADLVKFASLTPTKEECLEALNRGEHIVRRTVPTSGPSSAETPAAEAPSRKGERR